MMTRLRWLEIFCEIHEVVYVLERPKTAYVLGRIQKIYEIWFMLINRCKNRFFWSVTACQNEL